MSDALSQYKFYVDSQLAEIHNDMNALKGMIRLLGASVTSIQQSMTGSSGEFESSAVVKSSSFFSKFIQLEDKVDNLGFGLKQVIDQAEQSSVTLASIASNVAAVAGDTVAIATELKGVNDSLLQLENKTEEVIKEIDIDEMIDQVETVARTTQELVEAADDFWESIPFIGGPLKAAGDTISYAANAAAVGAAQAKRLQLGSVQKLIAGTSKEIIRLTSDVSRDIKDSDKASVNNIGAAVLASSTLSNFKIVNELINNTETEYSPPIVSYYLSALMGSSISQTLIDKFKSSFRQSDVVNDSTITALFDTTTVFPAHGFLVIEFMYGTLKKRRIIVSTGDYGSTLDGIYDAIFKGASFPSFFGYEDSILTRPNASSNTWTKIAASRSSGKRMQDLDKASLIDKFHLKVPIEALAAFIKAMKKYDTRPYNLLTHNCQVQCQEIMNYALGRNRPHWWNTTVSAEILLDLSTPTVLYSVVDGSEYRIPVVDTAWNTPFAPINSLSTGLKSLWDGIWANGDVIGNVLRTVMSDNFADLIARLDQSYIFNENGTVTRKSDGAIIPADQFPNIIGNSS